MLPVPRTPHSLFLTANEKDFSLSLEMTMWGKGHSPSFLRKEVPRGGGGWMGIAVFPKQSLPRVGKVASGASRIGYWRYEREEGDRLKCAINESTLSTADAVPLPQWGRLREGGFRSGWKRNGKMRFLLLSSCHARPSVSTVSLSHDLIAGHANQKKGL